MTEIHELQKLKIGNQEQYISIHGNDIEKPILLLLHGGPGMAQIGFIRYFTKELEKEFVVVNWDQRGAGKSYNSSIDTKTMNINQFVDDTLELSEYLTKRFNKQKIFLSGHSWGIILGIKAIQQKPNLYFAYIGISNVVDMKQGEEISYQFTLNKAKETNNDKAIKQLQSIGNPPFKNLDDNLLQRKWLDHFGGTTFNLKMNKLMQKASSTKEYSIWDFLWRFRKGMKFSLQYLLNELLGVDLRKENSFQVPVYFLQGANDYQVPTILARNYFDTIIAPTKHYEELQQCGHMIPFEQPEKWTNFIIDIKNKHNEN